MGRGKKANLYPDGNTCDWYSGSTYQYKKLYIKAAELIQHRTKNLKNASQEDKDYYQRLIEYCQLLALVREEHSFKRAWLRRHNLHIYGRTTEAEFCLI